MLRRTYSRTNTFRKRHPVAFGVVGGVVFVMAILFSMSRMTVLYSEGGVYLQTEHGGSDKNGNGTTGATRPANNPAGYPTISTTDFPTGSCVHCHDQHASNNATTHTQQDQLLFSTNDNAFCYVCHTNALTTGGSYQYPSWPGQASYAASAHGTNANVLWPAGVVNGPPARPAGDQNKCVNCHDPHGRSFAKTLDPNNQQAYYPLTAPVPAMTNRLEENMCLACHDTGPAVKNILTSFNRCLTATQNGAGGVFCMHPYSEYTTAGDRTPSVHTATETMPLGGANVALHSECVDCHNPHYARSGTHTPPTNLLSNVLLGAWGVNQPGWSSAQAKGNGTLQSAPVFSAQQLTNTATQYEWQLCLRCHSSYSTQPAFAAPNNLTDVSREINPNNIAHHPVAGPGNNVSANASFRSTFRAPYVYNSVIYCTDCHESNLEAGNGMTGAADAQGPHGSANKWLLGNFCDSAAGAVCTTPAQTVICFKCHKFSVYWSGGAGSRYTHPGNGGHQDNTRNVWGIWCMTCHGGASEGAIHGTNAAKGSGSAPIGEHFMNGSSIAGFDPGSKATATAGKCYMIAAANAYTNCNQHGTKTTGTPNYDY